MAKTNMQLIRPIHMRKMKMKNRSISSIIGLTFMLILCLSTTAFSEDYFLTQFSGSMSEEQQFHGGFTNSYMPFKEESVEIDVSSRKVRVQKPPTQSVSVSMSQIFVGGNCSDCGVYLKITSPDGKVVFDKSTPEKGFLKALDEQQNVPLIDPISGKTYEPTAGKYTVWFKPLAPNTIQNVTVNVIGIPKQ